LPPLEEKPISATGQKLRLSPLIILVCSRMIVVAGSTLSSDCDPDLNTSGTFKGNFKISLFRHSPAGLCIRLRTAEEGKISRNYISKFIEMDF
jgi:hypothetical protein